MAVLSHVLNVADATAVSQFPDEFGVLNFGPISAADVTLDTNKCAALMVTDRDMYVDTVAARAITDSSEDTTFAIAYVPSGSAVSAANTTTVSGNLDADMGDNTTVITDGLATSYDSNKIPAGSLVVVEFAATPTAIADLVITLRFHTRHN